MGVAGRGAHLENDVHERRRLRDLPVDARRGRARGHLAQVDDEVAHAPEEVVLVDIPLRAAAAGDVRVRVWKKTNVVSTGHGFSGCAWGGNAARTDDRHPDEARVGEQRRHVARIADELRVVVGAAGARGSAAAGCTAKCTHT